MDRLRYITSCSLDGFVEDGAGSFAFSVPADDVHAAFNDLVRDVPTYVYGRRMHETMSWWHAPPEEALAEPVTADFAELWQGADKVVVSRTLREVDQPRTRVVDDLTADLVEEVTAAGPATVGGADLAGQALVAGLVGEVALVVHPISVGGGKPALPVGTRVDLRLLSERRFSTGAVLLRYTVR